MKTHDLPCGVQQNLELIAQAETLLRAIDAATFSEPCEPVFNASIGQHLRHAIEHYDALLASTTRKGVVDYEHRQRDLVLESDPQVALHRLSEIAARLTETTDENVPLTVLHHGGGENPSSSSLDRELQFLASHTVHHFAMIGIIARITGLSLPASFGIAPSTLRHLEKNHAA